MIFLGCKIAINWVVNWFFVFTLRLSQKIVLQMKSTFRNNATDSLFVRQSVTYKDFGFRFYETNHDLFWWCGLLIWDQPWSHGRVVVRIWYQKTKIVTSFKWKNDCVFKVSLEVRLKDFCEKMGFVVFRDFFRSVLNQTTRILWVESWKVLTFFYYYYLFCFFACE